MQKQENARHQGTLRSATNSAKKIAFIAFFSLQMASCGGDRMGDKDSLKIIPKKMPQNGLIVKNDSTKMSSYISKLNNASRIVTGTNETTGAKGPTKISDLKPAPIPENSAFIDSVMKEIGKNPPKIKINR